MKQLGLLAMLLAASVLGVVGRPSQLPADPVSVVRADPPPMPPPAPKPTPSPVPTPTPPPPAPPAVVYPSVTAPATVKVKTGRYARVAVAYTGDDFKWETESLDAIDILREYDPDPKKLILRIGGEPGLYHLNFIAASVVNGKALMCSPVTCDVTIGTPTPPVPPTPPTPPVPPTPPPSPAPIAGAGLRVLMVYDPNATLPAAQQMILLGSAMRAELNGKCVMDADGKTHAWRIWPINTVPDGDTKSWADAFKLPRASVPWIVVSNPQSGGGFQGPLPASVDDTLTLLKKFGG